MKMNERKPRKIGGTSYAFVARGYPSTINRKAREQSTRGYTYRIFRDGRQALLYIGPKRTHEKVKRKKIKKTKKVKK